MVSAGELLVHHEADPAAAPVLTKTPRASSDKPKKNRWIGIFWKTQKDRSSSAPQLEHQQHYRTVRRFTMRAITHSVEGVTRSMCPGQPVPARKVQMGQAAGPSQKPREAEVK
jgi:hypothetical protein